MKTCPLPILMLLHEISCGGVFNAILNDDYVVLFNELPSCGTSLTGRMLMNIIILSANIFIVNIFYPLTAK